MTSDTELMERADELSGKIGQWLESDGLTSAEPLRIISEAGVLLALYKAAYTACQQKTVALDDALSIAHADLAAAQEEIKRLRGLIQARHETCRIYHKGYHNSAMDIETEQAIAQQQGGEGCQKSRHT